MFSDFSWWHVAYLLVTTHITIITVTVYLHRALAHRSLTIKKPLEHFFRFWSWFTTGQNPKEWAAVHRKHHAYCENEGDPHSPKIYGLWTVLFKGVYLYKKEGANAETIKRFGHFTPDDKLHNEFYAKYTWLGIVLFGLIEFALFGKQALWIFPIQLLWIPFWAAGVINGLAHHKGYRNFNTSDLSTNISPIGLIIGGEELHNNHHAYPTSAKLSLKWYEFDIGWFWISVFKKLNLLSVNKVHVLPKISSEIAPIDTSIEILLKNKSFILKMFYKKTKDSVIELLKTIKQEHQLLKEVSIKNLTSIYYFDNSKNELTENEKEILSLILKNKYLSYLYDKKQELLSFWEDKTLTLQESKEKLHIWTEKILKSNHLDFHGITDFARSIRSLH